MVFEESRPRRVVRGALWLIAGAALGAGSVLGAQSALEAPEPAPVPVIASRAPTPLDPVAGTTARAAAPFEADAPGDAAPLEPRPDPAPSSEAAVDPVQRAIACAVSIRAGRSYGAGALVAEGLVLTAHHVVDAGETAQLRFADGAWLDATVAASDPEADLSLLRFEPDAHTPAPVASALDLRPGAPLVAVGSPRELGFTLHRGMVSYAGRRFDSLRYVQTDLPANPGSSGGPVLDEAGRLVGVMAFVLRGSEGIAFVHAVDYARGLLESAGAVAVSDALASDAELARWNDDGGAR